MAFAFEQIIAGAPPTGGDSGTQFANKINNNFDLLKNTDFPYGKYSQLSGGNEIVGNVSQSSAITFSTIDNDDFNALSLANPTRITPPLGTSLCLFYIKAEYQIIYRNGVGSFVLYKNGEELFTISKFASPNATSDSIYFIDNGMFVTPPVNVTNGDYFEVYFVCNNATLTKLNQGAIFGMFVLK